MDVLEYITNHKRYDLPLATCQHPPQLMTCSQSINSLDTYIRFRLHLIESSYYRLAVDRVKYIL